MSMVKKNIKVVETVESVTITLSVDQAERLSTLLGFCTSKSGFTQLWNELRQAGMDGKKKYKVSNHQHSVTVESKPIW